MQKFLDYAFLILTKIYLSKGKHKTVVVTGSVGKTSVTQAIATALEDTFNTKVTKGNYNTNRGVSMTVFDMVIPFSRFGWLPLLISAVWTAFTSRPTFEVLVLELGSDQVGNIAKFDFLKPTIAVVTATTPEHMEFFKTIDAVAEEELTTALFAEKVIVNVELVPRKYIDMFVPKEKLVAYGRGTSNTIKAVRDEIVISLNDSTFKSKEFNLIGGAGQSTLLASAVVCQHLGMDSIEIKEGLFRIQPVAGRMNKFTGLNGSTIIDDTYNSSPEAVRSALDYLYAQNASRRVALLGMMNEMGDQSQELHELVGSWCDPSKLDTLVTLGKDANTYLANVAEKMGCNVVRAETPERAGQYIATQLTASTVVLAKGSQNGVYAEEAIKLLLADPSDSAKLVRQSSYWPKKKSKIWVTV